MITRILWAIYAGFVIFCLVSLFTGTLGFSNKTALNYFQQTLEDHVEDLQIKSIKLDDEIKRLTSDRDRIIVAARPMGYIESDQRVIKIIDSNQSNPLYDLDVQYSIPEFEQKTNRIFITSMLVTVILFVMSLFIGVIVDTFKRG